MSSDIQYILGEAFVIDNLLQVLDFESGVYFLLICKDLHNSSKFDQAGIAFALTRAWLHRAHGSVRTWAVAWATCAAAAVAEGLDVNLWCRSSIVKFPLTVAMEVSIDVADAPYCVWSVGRLAIAPQLVAFVDIMCAHYDRLTGSIAAARVIGIVSAVVVLGQCRRKIYLTGLLQDGRYVHIYLEDTQGDYDQSIFITDLPGEIEDWGNGLVTFFRDMQGMCIEIDDSWEAWQAWQFLPIFRYAADGKPYSWQAFHDWYSDSVLWYWEAASLNDPRHEAMLSYREEQKKDI